MGNASTVLLRADKLGAAVVENKLDDAVEILSKAGPEALVASSQRKKKFSPLLIAAERGQVSMVDVLCAALVKMDEQHRQMVLEIKGSKRETALMKACKNGCTEVVVALLKAGACPMGMSKDGSTCIHLCIDDESTPECLQQLLSCTQRGIPLGDHTSHDKYGPVRMVDRRNNKGYTALHMAVLRDNIAAARVLLQGGACAAAGTAEPSNVAWLAPGSTALHIAAAMGKVDLCHLLHTQHSRRTSRNDDLANIRNSMGLKAAQCAMLAGHYSLASELLELQPRAGDAQQRADSEPSSGRRQRRQRSANRSSSGGTRRQRDGTSGVAPIHSQDAALASLGINEPMSKEVLVSMMHRAQLLLQLQGLAEHDKKGMAKLRHQLEATDGQLLDEGELVKLQEAHVDRSELLQLQNAISALQEVLDRMESDPKGSAAAASPQDSNASAEPTSNTSSDSDSESENVPPAASSRQPRTEALRRRTSMDHSTQLGGVKSAPAGQFVPKPSSPAIPAAHHQLHNQHHTSHHHHHHHLRPGANSLNKHPSIHSAPPVGAGQTGPLNPFNPPVPAFANGHLRRHPSTVSRSSSSRRVASPGIRSTGSSWGEPLSPTSPFTVRTGSQGSRSGTCGPPHLLRPVPQSVQINMPGKLSAYNPFCPSGSASDMQAASCGNAAAASNAAALNPFAANPSAAVTATAEPANGATSSSNPFAVAAPPTEAATTAPPASTNPVALAAPPTGPARSAGAAASHVFAAVAPPRAVSDTTAMSAALGSHVAVTSTSAAADRNLVTVGRAVSAVCPYESSSTEQALHLLSATPVSSGQSGEDTVPDSPANPSPSVMTNRSAVGVYSGQTSPVVLSDTGGPSGADSVRVVHYAHPFAAGQRLHSPSGVPAVLSPVVIPAGPVTLGGPLGVPAMGPVLLIPSSSPTHVAGRGPVTYACAGTPVSPHAVGTPVPPQSLDIEDFSAPVPPSPSSNESSSRRSNADNPSAGSRRRHVSSVVVKLPSAKQLQPSSGSTSNVRSTAVPEPPICPPSTPLLSSPAPHAVPQVPMVARSSSGSAARTNLSKTSTLNRKNSGAVASPSSDAAAKVPATADDLAVAHGSSAAAMKAAPTPEQVTQLPKASRAERNLPHMAQDLHGDSRGSRLRGPVRSPSLCPICMEGPLDVAIGECLHRLCMRCAQGICCKAPSMQEPLCPFCRTQIRTFLKLVPAHVVLSEGLAQPTSATPPMVATPDPVPKERTVQSASAAGTQLVSR